MEGERMKWLFFLTTATALASCSASATEVRDDDPIACIVALMIESKNAKSRGNLELPALLSPFTKWFALAGKESFLNGDGKDRIMVLAKDYGVNWQLRKTVAKRCLRIAAENPAFEQALPQLRALPEFTM